MITTELFIPKGKISGQETNLSVNAGEEIGYEKGAKMVKNYYDQNDGEISSHTIGRDMIEAILAQPGTTGITILSGINELGLPKPVLVGVNAKGNYILSITTVGANGKMDKQKGIVATGVLSPGTGTKPHGDCSWWG